MPRPRTSLMGAPDAPPASRAERSFGASPRRTAPTPGVVVLDTATAAALVEDAVEARVVPALAAALATLAGPGHLPPVLTAEQVGTLLGGITADSVFRSHARTDARPQGIPWSRPGNAALFLLDDVLAYVRAYSNAPR